MAGMDKEYLIAEFWRYYDEFGVYPTKISIAKAEGYPSASPYIRIWGSWGKFIADIGVLGDEGWYIYDEKVLIERYESSSQQDIINSLMIKKSWSTIKQKARKLGLKRNRTLAKREYTDEELLDVIKSLSIKLGRTPRNLDLEEAPDAPSPKTYHKRFGSWNNVLRLLELKINTQFSHDKSTIKKEAIEFYKAYGRSPYYNDLNFSRTIIYNYWANWNAFLMECKLPLNNTRELSNLEYETLASNNIKYLIELAESLERIPFAEEYYSYLDQKETKNYLPRSGISNWIGKNFTEFCRDFLPVEILESKLNKAYFDKNKNRCFSLPELKISNLLIENKVRFKRETLYRDVLFTEENIRFDWEITNKTGNSIYVEYFGLYKNSQQANNEMLSIYRDKTKRKIKLCQENGVELIALFPRDIRNNFEGLIKKFKSHGILIKTKNSNIKTIQKCL